MRSSVVAVALAALCAGVVSVQAFDELKYPDWSGQWRLGPPTKWDPSKPPGRGQEAPLTPEYQAIFEANLADQAAGGQGTDPTYICIPDGMPRAMNVVFPMEIVITPKTSYIMIEDQHAAANLHRRPRLAERSRARLYGLFDRQMDR